jgi:hypothetical protein
MEAHERSVLFKQSNKACARFFRVSTGKGPSLGMNSPKRIRRRIGKDFYWSASSLRSAVSPLVSRALCCTPVVFAF